MRHLLDTHTLLWYARAEPQLSSTAKALILDPANEILISPASFWELAIKVSVGKLVLRQPFQDFLDLCLKQCAMTLLPIEPRHTVVLSSLPFHHRDPFDRMLIAQVMVEGIPIISIDQSLDAYPIQRLW